MFVGLYVLLVESFESFKLVLASEILLVEIFSFYKSLLLSFQDTWEDVDPDELSYEVNVVLASCISYYNWRLHSSDGA